MNRRIQPTGVVIAVLAAIGILSVMMMRPADLILAVVVFGTVFLLYKYPPKRWKKAGMRKSMPASSRSKPKGKRKQIPFRVIKGNKRDDDSDNPNTLH